MEKRMFDREELISQKIEIAPNGAVIKVVETVAVNERFTLQTIVRRVASPTQSQTIEFSQN